MTFDPMDTGESRFAAHRAGLRFVAAKRRSSPRLQRLVARRLVALPALPTLLPTLPALPTLTH